MTQTAPRDMEVTPSPSPYKPANNADSHKDVGVVVPPKTMSKLRQSSSRSTEPEDLPSSPAPPPVPASAKLPSGPTAEERRAVLDKLTKERNTVLDRWADAKTLSLSTHEAELNKFLKKDLKYLFGQTGFDPPVPARNPVSVSMHNPRFAAALWAVNTEAYRRRGKVSLFSCVLVFC